MFIVDVFAVILSKALNLTIIEKTQEPTQNKNKINPKYVGKKMSRNEPCYCGSGKKYKHCCGRF